MAEGADIPGSSRPQTISVVIRSCTQTDEVLRLIGALARQTRPPDEFVVIDSGSADWVADGLREHAEKGVEGRGGTIPLRLIEIPNEAYQSARSLNQAVATAEGELVAIISQDALPAGETYLERLAAPFANHQVAGTYGRQVLGETYDPLGEKDLLMTYPPVSRTQRAPDCWFVNTCSMIRRGLFLRHPFDEQARISEDHEWGKWAQGEGYVLKYVADAVVQHYHPFRHLSELWERHIEEGRGLACIHGKRVGAPRAILRYCWEVASDAFWLLRRGKPWYVPVSILRRAIKYAAIYWGGRTARGHCPARPSQA